jgi:hypothetical protein
MNLAAVRDKWRILLKMVMNRALPQNFLPRHSSQLASLQPNVRLPLDQCTAANIQNGTRTFRCDRITMLRRVTNRTRHQAPGPGPTCFE